MTLTLQRDGYELALAPQLGGSVLSFKHEGIDLLRPAPPITGSDWDARDFAAFPLVPFCGRITNGKFTINQLTVSLPPNMPPEPHAIHGSGWQSNWTCDTHSSTDAILTYRHASGTWPWPFEARQHFTLLEDGLRVNLSLTNTGTAPMPAGLGWHPYFPRPAAELIADTRGAWLTSETNTTDLVSPCPSNMDLTQPRRIDDLTLDHAFNLGDRQVQMRWPTHALTLQSDPVFSHLVVYSPPGEAFFCVEPLSHTPNAVNMARPAEETGLRVLRPGQNLNGTVRLVLSKTS
ncbi:MAG: aldose 1-epimerase [Henriciella sp.]|nr:aldose 1-epimerase [Henriciella sp.]